jgi:hypothetical protein
MEMVFVALALFIGLIFCWLMLPGSTTQADMPYEIETASHPAAQQLV